jgi:PleD family two-component response regulator
MFQQLGNRVAGIDEHRLASVLASDDESVLLKRTAGANFHYHGVMILAVVDDLMFMSKIKATAQQLGVDVAFARSSDAALNGMRTNPPALVIFDLNNPRTDPLGTVAVMKGDPALASIPTVGFVSHVQADLIDAARAAGVNDVLARSVFTARLAEILKGR